jgi:predicted ABC-type transport system involved in lysophospholipase L1 biosynthesis ATPase subunit
VPQPCPQGDRGVPGDAAVTLLELKNVRKSFLDGAREVVVLDDVSVEFDARELIGIYGGRRSGKSTFLMIATGLEMPDRGAVNFRGQDITKLSVGECAKLRRQRGLAFVSGDWRPELANQPAIEHVAMPMTNDGMTLAEGEAAARVILSRFEVMRWAHVATDRLSAGERIRVELARAVVREPAILFVDEPAVLSSPSESRDLYALLHSLAKEMTVVIASEDMDAISGVDRFMTLDGGKLRTTDSRKRLYDAADRFRAGKGRSS